MLPVDQPSIPGIQSQGSCSRAPKPFPIHLSMFLICLVFVFIRMALNKSFVKLYLYPVSCRGSFALSFAFSKAFAIACMSYLQFMS